MAEQKASGRATKHFGGSVLIIMKRFFTISVLLQAVTGLMTLVLVMIFAVYAMHALQAQQQARRVPVIVEISDHLFTAARDTTSASALCVLAMISFETPAG